nr:RNA-directed DNA polymerase, eukaryota [Tanacetum cinerariifolium]
MMREIVSLQASTEKEVYSQFSRTHQDVFRIFVRQKIMISSFIAQMISSQRSRSSIISMLKELQRISKTTRALLFKWVWRYISGDSSLWCRFIKAMHGITLSKTSKFRFSNWITIVREVFRIKDCGVDFLSHYHLRVGNGLLRGGTEASQLDLLQESIQNVILSNMDDRWTWDLNGECVFRVKYVRFCLDEFFLLKAAIATRWVKYILIKVNIFVWKLFLDRLPTRDNLLHRGVLVPNALCSICSSAQEDSSHLFFSCCMVTKVVRLIRRWWNIDWSPLGSYVDWLSWFNSIRFNSFLKALLEGFFYTAWWSVWIFRNQLLFSSQAHRKDVLFDDIMSRTFYGVIPGVIIRLVGIAGYNIPI